MSGGLPCRPPAICCRCVRVAALPDLLNRLLVVGEGCRALCPSGVLLPRQAHVFSVPLPSSSFQCSNSKCPLFFQHAAIQAALRAVPLWQGMRILLPLHFHPVCTLPVAGSWPPARAAGRYGPLLAAPVWCESGLHAGCSKIVQAGPPGRHQTSCRRPKRPKRCSMCAGPLLSTALLSMLPKFAWEQRSCCSSTRFLQACRAPLQCGRRAGICAGLQGGVSFHAAARPPPAGGRRSFAVAPFSGSL